MFFKPISLNFSQLNPEQIFKNAPKADFSGEREANNQQTFGKSDIEQNDVSHHLKHHLPLSMFKEFDSF